MIFFYVKNTVFVGVLQIAVLTTSAVR